MGSWRRFRRSRLTGLAVLACLAGVSGAVAASSGATKRPVWMSPPAVTVANYSFDGAGEAAWADSSGHGHTLAPVSSSGAVAKRVTHGDGGAVQFPQRCDQQPCPRMVLRAAGTAVLNPGSRLLYYGASVLLGAGETSEGENILQKGYSAEGSQYKLQIDGHAGRPSCVLVGDVDHRIHLATATISVADGAWHRLECRREQATLTILIDGIARGSTSLPPALSITNDRPLSLGGKSAYGDNDQFHGLLDDVWIAIG
jgi:hypothetical protein